MKVASVIPVVYIEADGLVSWLIPARLASLGTLLPSVPAGVPAKALLLCPCVCLEGTAERTSCDVSIHFCMCLSAPARGAVLGLGTLATWPALPSLPLQEHSTGDWKRQFALRGRRVGCPPGTWREEGPWAAHSVLEEGHAPGLAAGLRGGQSGARAQHMAVQASSHGETEARAADGVPGLPVNCDERVRLLGRKDKGQGFWPRD